MAASLRGFAKVLCAHRYTVECRGQKYSREAWARLAVNPLEPALAKLFFSEFLSAEIISVARRIFLGGGGKQRV